MLLVGFLIPLFLVKGLLLFHIVRILRARGKIVSFCTFRLDAPSGLTELEPMGTRARNKGIGRAILVEGFRRLQKYNPSLLYIGGAANKPPANRLYELTGFTERYDLIRWEKIL